MPRYHDCIGDCFNSALRAVEEEEEEGKIEVITMPESPCPTKTPSSPFWEEVFTQRSKGMTRAGRKMKRARLSFVQRCKMLVYALKGERRLCIPLDEHAEAEKGGLRDLQGLDGGCGDDRG